MQETSNHQPVQPQHPRKLSARDLALQIISADSSSLSDLDEEIAKAEAALNKLKEARKVIAKCLGINAPRVAKQTKHAALNGDLEEQIVRYVDERGPAKPGEISDALGIGFAPIGKTVKASSRLAKNDLGQVVIA